jgi:hypothetical protein
MPSFWATGAILHFTTSKTGLPAKRPRVDIADLSGLQVVVLGGFSTPKITPEACFSNNY